MLGGGANGKPSWRSLRLDETVQLGYQTVAA